jgi:hypothetical protein
MSIVPDEARAMDNELKPCPWCQDGGVISSGEDEQEAADYGIALVDKEISATFEYSQITWNKGGYDEALASLKRMKTLRNLLERAKR